MDKRKFADLVFLATGTAIVLLMLTIVSINFFKDGRLFEKPVIAAVEETTATKNAKINTQNVIVQPEGNNKTLVYRRPTDPPRPSKSPSEASPSATPSPLVDYGEAIPPSMQNGKDITPKPSTTATPATKPPATADTNTKEGTTSKPELTNSGTTKDATPKPSGTGDPTKDAAPKPSTTGMATPGTEKLKLEVMNYSGIKNLAEDLRARLESNGHEVSAGNATSNKPVKTEIVERNDKKAGAEVKRIIGFGTISKQVDGSSRFDATIIIGDDFPR